MKKLIVLLIVILGGFYFIFKPSEMLNDDFDNYEEEEFAEDTEPSKDKPPPPPAKKAEKPMAVPKSPPPALSEKTPPNTVEAKEENNQAEKERGQAMVKAIKNFTPKDLEEVQLYYERLESRWKSVVKNTIGENNYAEYETMREEFQRERKESFIKFHESMIAEYGEKHVYSPVEYENQVGKKIQEAYFNRFKERFGPEVHERYRKLLQRFNGEAKRNQDPAKGLLKIFF